MYYNFKITNDQIITTAIKYVKTTKYNYGD